ncbi:hypothetical protein P0D69_32995 [Paraburkholderia sediminicola]|uniref:hypothetical protein n=1 Tax=Paraburkholderia sediminicola TaxID=458836 RepID=UPI0038BD1121
MSVPLSISQLSTTPSLNSPAGAEAIGNNLALYLNAHAAFIAQVANASGFTPASAISMNSFQINNVAAGTAATDAVNKSQLNSYLPIGTVLTWSGAVANIPSVWGSNWALCNGQNGTPNLMDRFIIGAGNGYAVGATGGTTSYALSTANMPAHTHGVYDPGHAHAVSDPGHAHSIYDPGHAHSIPPGGWGQAGQDNGGISGTSAPNQYGTFSGGIMGTYPSGTGIGIYGAGTGIGIYGSGTGIQIGSTGSGAAFTVIPPYYALAYVMKIANN